MENKWQIIKSTKALLTIERSIIFLYLHTKFDFLTQLQESCER